MGDKVQTFLERAVVAPLVAAAALLVRAWITGSAADQVTAFCWVLVALVVAICLLLYRLSLESLDGSNLNAELEAQNDAFREQLADLHRGRQRDREDNIALRGQIAGLEGELDRRVSDLGRMTALVDQAERELGTLRNQCAALNDAYKRELAAHRATRESQHRPEDVSDPPTGPH